MCSIFLNITEFILGVLHSLHRDYITAIASQNPTPYEGDVSLPMFCTIPSGQKRLFSVEATVECLLHPNINRKFICERVPISISHNVCFLVDSSKLADSEDILSDDMGTWKHNGVDTTFLSIKTDSNGPGIKSVVKCKRNSPEAYRLKRSYRIHNTDGSLRKVTASIYG